MGSSDLEREREQGQTRIRNVYNLVMGLLWTSMGVLLLGHEWFHISISIDPLIGNLFGFACLVYGGFRLWRGYKGYVRRS